MPGEGPSEPPQTGPRTALTSLTDAALSPVQEVLHGRAFWLRASLVAHLLSTAAAAGVAWQLGLVDWQLYLWLGAFTFVLVGNFMRWRKRSSLVRRVLGVLAALAVELSWAVLLLDRARSDWDPRLYRASVQGNTLQALSVDFRLDHQWFWLPVVLQVLVASLLVAHFFGGPTLRTQPPAQLRRS